jgi:hypothetical protein
MIIGGVDRAPRQNSLLPEPADMRVLDHRPLPAPVARPSPGPDLRHPPFTATNHGRRTLR